MLRTAAVRLPPAILLLVLACGRGWSKPPHTFVTMSIEGPAPSVLTAQPLKPEPGDDELRKLLKERYNAALAELQGWVAEFHAGNHRMPRDATTKAAQRVLEARLELSSTPEDRIRIRQELVWCAWMYERVIRYHHHAGRIGIAELEKARYLRLDAQIKLLRAKREAAAARPKSEHQP